LGVTYEARTSEHRLVPETALDVVTSEYVTWYSAQVSSEAD